MGSRLGWIYGGTAAISKSRRHGPICRDARFPLIEEYANGDNFHLDDRAIFATDGPRLELDSAAFKRPDQGHRTSPWFKLPLRLHTVEGARDRYRQWASGEWERIHTDRRPVGLTSTASPMRCHDPRTLMPQSNPRGVDPGGRTPDRYTFSDCLRI